MLLLICLVPGDASGLLIIKPVGNVHSSESFEISGTVSDPGCNRIGIEIFPRQYWEKAKKIAKDRRSKGFRLVLHSVVHMINTAEAVSMNGVYTGVFLNIYNPDETTAYLPAPSCPDHRLHFCPVKHQPGVMHEWASIFNDAQDRKKCTLART